MLFVYPINLWYGGKDLMFLAIHRFASDFGAGGKRFRCLRVTEFNFNRDSKNVIGRTVRTDEGARCVPILL